MEPSVNSEQTEADNLEVFRQYRSLLFAISYRMLGSSADAEDMLQETFIRWQRSSSAEVRSPKAFLVTIISRLCINHLRSARMKREEYVGHWLPEPVMTGGPSSDPSATSMMDESLSTGFLVLLERLTPTERAVFLLRDVFDYEYSAIAQIFNQNEANCRQILRRARKHVAGGLTRFDASPQQCQDLLQKFLGATVNGDMQGLLSTFSQDIVLYTDGGGKAAALINPIYGAQDVARALVGAFKKFSPANAVAQIIEINARPGIVSYLNGDPHTVISVDMSEGRLRNIYILRNPDKLKNLPRME
jgi:RNA polymerase sigma-70 factor (ECF subfamily)